MNQKQKKGISYAISNIKLNSMNIKNCSFKFHLFMDVHVNIGYMYVGHQHWKNVSCTLELDVS